jgi:predicted HicB family RNase H-like nuclease
MKYKGYQGYVVYDDEAKLFHGEVVGLKDMITFQGQSVQELEQAFKDSIEDYLEFCKELGRPPEKPYSGKILIRMSPQDHEKAALEAKTHGLSMNEWIIQTIHNKLSTEDHQSTKKLVKPHYKHSGTRRRSIRLQKK